MADLIQNTGSAAASTTALVHTMLQNAQIGNTLFAMVESNNSGLTSITGGGAGTGADAWAPVVVGGLTNSIELWKCAVTGSPTTTATFNTPTARIGVRVLEYSGRYILDQSGTADATSATITTPTITPLFPFELLLACGCVFQNISSGPTGPWTTLSNVSAATFTMGCAALQQTDIAAAGTTWATTSSGWDALIASFRAVPYLPQVDELTDLIAVA